MGTYVVQKKLEAILKYKMTQMEALAYKCCLLWEEITNKELPGYSCVKLRKSGDPRKSVLFKYCYKLVRETQGILPPTEYRFYILAQIQIMGRMRNGDVHALVEPVILAGPRAWTRWRWWKENYDRNMRRLTTHVEDLKIKPPVEKIKIELQKTRDFLAKQSGTLQEWYDSRKLHQWLVMEKVSPYFILLHPELKDKKFDRDLSIYEVTEDIMGLSHICLDGKESVPPANNHDRKSSTSQPHPSRRS